MTRCLRCAYALIRDRCPMCGGRCVKGVERFPAPTPNAAVDAPAPLPLYWSPNATA